MEGRNRSGSHSGGGVVKNRSSSGCLIIKKKNNDGVSGVGSSSKGSKIHESKKEKKRPRLSVNDSLSSEDDEGFEFNRNHGVERVSGGGGLLDGFGDMGFRRNGMMWEVGPKRSKLDVYDFDEYDDLGDVEMLRTRHYHDRGLGGGERRFLGAMPGMKGGGSGVEFESGSSKSDIIYKRRNSFNGSSSGEKIKSDHLYGRRRFEMRNKLPISMGKEKLGGSDDAIRLQGRNGVLKVRVKHKEEISDQLPKNYVLVKGNNVVPRSLELTPKNSVIRPSPYSEKYLPKKPMSVDTLDKKHLKRCKPMSAESSEESDEEAEDSDSSPKVQTDNVQVHRSGKRGRNGGCMEAPQKTQPVKLKEGKVKRGSGTEKQLLREKIRNMLTSAGWKIDYRPRRGRDYFDAVYVNPTGTAYWSIIKAYDALQKQLEEEGKILKASEDSSSFAPISEDVLSKLTRQTRKKIEKELKRKKREEAGGKRKKEYASGNLAGDESDTDSGGSIRRDDKLSSYMKRSAKFLKGASKESYGDGSNSSCKMQERGERSSAISNSRLLHARKSKKIGRCTLLVRNSDKGMDSESDGFIPYTGRRNLLSWLIDSGTVKLSEKVHYMNRRCTRVMLEGWITREGIHCGCCSKILTVSKFEIHAASKLRQPYQNIYLSSGASLMQCQVDAWNKQEESLRNGCNNIDVNGDDPNDDTCAICGDGGNLICCDSCPSTFHQNCLGIEMLPSGDWHCPHCSCRFCGLADMSVTDGDDRRQDTVLTCCLCEGKYHSSCADEMDGTSINSSSPPFCGKACQELSEQLQKLLGVKHELEAGLVWSLIQRTDLGSDTSVRGFPQRVEWNSKLAVALNVMDECFLPIIDRRSGINLIHSVLYNSGSNITRLNYSSFYTAILEKGDEIVSTACIRIRGNQFAEMPFIGTRHIYRRQGMCRRLFSAIELALCSLKVEKMIIPAISELMDTWSTVFGFSTLEESDKCGMKVGNMLVFPGTDMLQKKLWDHDSTKRGFAGVDLYENGYSASSFRKESDLHFSPGISAAAEPESEDMNDKSSTDFDTQDMVSLDENILNSASADFCEEVKRPLPSENEEIKDISVAVIGSQDMACTDKKSSLYNASVDCCKEVKPSLPTINDETIDKHATDIGSQVIVCTDENYLPSGIADCCDKLEPSLPTVSSRDSSDEKPSLLTASAAAEFKPLVLNEKSLGTASSELQLDKFDESAVKLKDHIFADASAGSSEPLDLNEGSLGTTISELKLNTKVNESAADVKEHDSADPCTTACFLDDSLASQHAGASIDFKLTEEAKMTVAESGSPPADGNLADTSDNGLLNGFPMKDNTNQRDGILPSENESAAYRKDHSITNSSHDDVTEKPITDPPVEDNICDPLDIEGDDAHINPVKNDVCSGSQFLHVSGPPVEDNICNPPDVARDDAHIDPAETDVCSGSQLLHVSEPPAEDNICNPPGVARDDTHINPAETDVCSGSPSLRVFDNTDLDAAHEPKICISRNDMVCSQIIETLPVDDMAYKSPQNVSTERSQRDSGQPTLEGDVQHVEVANVQPISNILCEVFVNTVEENTSSEDPPSVSGDRSIGVSGLLPVSELHGQGSM